MTEKVKRKLTPAQQQFGNKNAVGADSGRPRTSSPPPEECVKLGKELVKWATEETKEWRCLFQQWYSLEKGIRRKDWKNLILAPEFSPYYEKAQAALAKKAVDGTIEKSFGHRYIRLYDKALIDEENEQAKHDANLKKEILNDTSDFIVKIINYAKEKS